MLKELEVSLLPGYPKEAVDDAKLGGFSSVLKSLDEVTALPLSYQLARSLRVSFESLSDYRWKEIPSGKEGLRTAFIAISTGASNVFALRYSRAGKLGRKSDWETVVAIPTFETAGKIALSLVMPDRESGENDFKIEDKFEVKAWLHSGTENVLSLSFKMSDGYVGEVLTVPQWLARAAMKLPLLDKSRTNGTDSLHRDLWSLPHHGSFLYSPTEPLRPIDVELYASAITHDEVKDWKKNKADCLVLEYVALAAQGLKIAAGDSV
jgi:hypothetical protein